MTNLDRAWMLFQTGVIFVGCGANSGVMIIGVGICITGIIGVMYYEKP